VSNGVIRADRELACLSSSNSCCEHGDIIVRGEWSPDSQFFVFNVESAGGHQPGHRPVFFYSRSENKLYRLENYIGYIGWDNVVAVRLAHGWWIILRKTIAKYLSQTVDPVATNFSAINQNPNMFQWYRNGTMRRAASATTL